MEIDSSLNTAASLDGKEEGKRSFLCIYRAQEFSPNMVNNDAAIMDAVAERLVAQGHSVKRIHEEELRADDLNAPLAAVFSMGRREETLRLLEASAVACFNTPASIRNCQRHAFTSLFHQHNIPQPAWQLLTPQTPNPKPKTPNLKPQWVKRGEGYSQEADDVVFVSSQAELSAAVERLFAKGCERVILSEHSVGDLVKFYGVGDRFFYWYYANEGHSKFGWEDVNGVPHRYQFQVDALQRLCSRAASVLGLHIYGGDCIIAPDGTASIIDFNDWPSFSRCREEMVEYLSPPLPTGGGRLKVTSEKLCKD